MKQVLLPALIAFVLSSCDPVAQMEANIENQSSENLSISFVSSDTTIFPNKLLQIPSGETVLFQEGFDVGNTFLEPSLVEYDSVIVRNQADEVLRTYKPNDTGKTIYNVDAYWTGRETSKWVYEYEYQIEVQDLE